MFTEYLVPLQPESVRVCSRSAIVALQRHTLHLQVREASWFSFNRRLADVIELIIMSNDIIEYELLGEDDPSLLIAMEPLWRGMADELQELHYLKGVKFVNQLKLIVYNGKFQAVDNESNIFSALNEQSPDYENLLNAVRKAVEHGYRVYILPNPKGIRTADFIFVRKSIYRLYDLKTIHGKASVLNRLMESIGQTNHVLLNLSTDYPATSLARSIKKYFERNTEAAQVLIFRGNKVMSVTRKTLEDRNFIATFTKLFYK